MDPPFALIGPGTTLGFGFQSLILDLSGTETPPQLLSKFGVGDDFRGLYLPDVRVFVRPPGLDGLGIDVSARELLIGIGPEGGVSGIFGLDIVKPDSPQHIDISIYDEFGALVLPLEVPEGADPFTFMLFELPAKTQWVVDVLGGQPPYNIQVDVQVQTTDPIMVTFPAGQQSKDVDDPGRRRAPRRPVAFGHRSDPPDRRFPDRGGAHGQCTRRWCRAPRPMLVPATGSRTRTTHPPRR